MEGCSCHFYWKNAVFSLVWCAMSAGLIYFVVWMFGYSPAMSGAMYPLIVLAPICGGASLYMVACSWWSCSGRDPLTDTCGSSAPEYVAVVPQQPGQTYQGVVYRV